MSNRGQTSQTGFTLAELLIALAILGIICTFALPKILQGQQDSRRKAVFQETFSTLADLSVIHARTGAVFANTTELKDYFRTRMNYAKICTVDPDTEGCWTGGAGAGNADGYVLHNGAYLISFNGGAGTDRETVAVDWNGASPPNTYGVDVIGITLCLGPNNCSATIGGTGPKGPGAIGPSLGNESAWDGIYAD
jgi:prepilin-type N-terminal cleavage/methylation domain-containing protein